MTNETSPEKDVADSVHEQRAHQQTERIGGFVFGPSEDDSERSETD